MATPEIPKKQKAAVFDQPGTVSTKVVEIDVPEPGAGEVLINLLVYPTRPFALFQSNTSSKIPFGRVPLRLWSHDQLRMTAPGSQ